MLVLLFFYIYIYICNTCDYTFHYPIISKQNCFFHKLPVQEYFQSPTVKALEGLVDLILTDGPWGVLWDSLKKHILKEDKVRDADIKATAEGAAMVLKPETGTARFVCDPLWNVMNRLKRFTSLTHKILTFAYTIKVSIPRNPYTSSIFCRYHLCPGDPLDRRKMESSPSRRGVVRPAIAVVHGQDGEAFRQLGEQAFTNAELRHVRDCPQESPRLFLQPSRYESLGPR